MCILVDISFSLVDFGRASVWGGVIMNEDMMSCFSRSLGVSLCVIPL